jgi:DnaJ-class molecular chaperone
MEIEVFKKLEKIKQKYRDEYPCRDCDGTGVEFSKEFTGFCFWCHGSGIADLITDNPKGQYRKEIKEVLK